MKRSNQTKGGGRAKHSISADSIRVYNLQEKASMKAYEDINDHRSYIQN